MPNGGRSVLSVRGLEVTYARDDWSFRYPDFSVEAGACLGISGYTGCGKTTLLNALFQPSFQGIRQYREALLLGKDLRSFGHGISRIVSYMPQYAQDGLNPMLTAGEQMCAVLNGNELSLSDFEIETALKSVDLDSAALHLYPHQMSGGMKQRFVLVLAYLKRPSLMVLDEPSSAIDALTLGSILAFLKGVKSAGTALLIVSHDIGFMKHLVDASISLECC